MTSWEDSRIFLQKLEHKVNSESSLEVHILMNRGERRRNQLRHWNIIKANHRDVIGYFQALFPGARIMIPRHNICSYDKSRNSGMLCYFCTDLFTGFNIHFLLEHQRLIKGDCVVCQCSLVAQETFLKHTTVFNVGGSEGDTFVSSLNQILGSLIASGEIFQTNITKLIGFNVTVDEYDRNIESGDGIEKFIFENTGEKQSVHIPVLKEGNQFFAVVTVRSIR